MKVSFILLLIAFVAAVTFAEEDEEDKLWNNFKSNFAKNHKSKEDAKRKSIFLETEKKIKKHNKSGAQWMMVHNKFSDMREEEKKTWLGILPPPLEKSNRSVEVMDVLIDERQTLPASLDLRKDKCLIPPKNQGTCGSCWAFSTTPPLEFQACKKSGKPVSFSEQQMVDCDRQSQACSGGWYYFAWEYLIKTKAGVSTAINYPYVSGQTNGAGYCRVSGPGAASSTRVASWSWTTPRNKAEPIRSALVKYGPIPVALKVISSFYNFGKGIYNDPACNSRNTYDVNHAVVIVGYGTKSGTDYWIVRNSWGIFWGDGGYFYIKRGVNQCQIESWSAYVAIK